MDFKLEEVNKMSYLNKSDSSLRSCTMIKLLFILIALLLLSSCKDNDNDCVVNKTIKWTYPQINGKVGFKIMRGDKSPSEVLKTIAPSENKTTEANVNLDVCKANYIAVIAFDDLGNESLLSPVVCIGNGCVTIVEKKRESPLSAPGLVLE